MPQKCLNYPPCHVIRVITFEPWSDHVTVIRKKIHALTPASVCHTFIWLVHLENVNPPICILGRYEGTFWDVSYARNASLQLMSLIHCRAQEVQYSPQQMPNHLCSSVLLKSSTEGFWILFNKWSTIYFLPWSIARHHLSPDFFFIQFVDSLLNENNRSSASTRVRGRNCEPHLFIINGVMACDGSWIALGWESPWYPPASNKRIICA